MLLSTLRLYVLLKPICVRIFNLYGKKNDMYKIHINGLIRFDRPPGIASYNYRLTS